MMKWGFQALDSIDVARTAQPRICFVCDGINLCESEWCHRCGAPMACAFPNHESAHRRQMIAVLGSPKAGKTVYLGMLTDILSRTELDLQILARGAYSVSLQQGVMHALSCRRFPVSTTQLSGGWNWLHCEVRGLSRQRQTDLILPDVAGSSLLAELDEPSTVPVLRPFLVKCASALVVVDCERVAQGDQQQEFFARKVIHYLGELAPSRKTGWPARPMAFVFTKADRSPDCWNNPARFAERYMPALWRQCDEQLKQYRFFAATSVGRCAQLETAQGTVNVPLRVEPRGVVEPFYWLVEQTAGKQ